MCVHCLEKYFVSRNIRKIIQCHHTPLRLLLFEHLTQALRFKLFKRTVPNTILWFVLFRGEYRDKRTLGHIAQRFRTWLPCLIAAGKLTSWCFVWRAVCLTRKKKQSLVSIRTIFIKSVVWGVTKPNWVSEANKTRKWYLERGTYVQSSFVTTNWVYS